MTGGPNDRAAERAQMVAGQLRERGVTDPRVLEALGSVPRELFVPEHLQDLAYADRALGIGEGQTISQPLIVARSCELLGLTGTERVLEVGAGSGYQAAVLAALAKDVVTIDRLPALVARARENLARAGVTNVEVVEGDGSQGFPPHAPYDAIVVAAGAPHIPAALGQQLAEGGRLVLPVGTRNLQWLTQVVRHGDRFETRKNERCIFVPLVGQDAYQT